MIDEEISGKNCLKDIVNENNYKDKLQAVDIISLQAKDIATAVAIGEKSSNIENLDFDNPDILNNLDCPNSETNDLHISIPNGPSPVNALADVDKKSDDFQNPAENVLNSEALITPAKSSYPLKEPICEDGLFGFQKGGSQSQKIIQKKNMDQIDEDYGSEKDNNVSKNFETKPTSSEMEDLRTIQECIVDSNQLSIQQADQQMFIPKETTNNEQQIQSYEVGEIKSASQNNLNDKKVSPERVEDILEEEKDQVNNLNDQNQDSIINNQKQSQSNDYHIYGGGDGDTGKRNKSQDLSQSYSQKLIQKCVQNNGFIPVDSDFNNQPGLVQSQSAQQIPAIQTKEGSGLSQQAQKHNPNGYNIVPHPAITSQNAQYAQQTNIPQQHNYQPPGAIGTHSQTFGACTQAQQNNAYFPQSLPKQGVITGTFNPTSGNFNNQVTGNSVHDPRSISPPGQNNQKNAPSIPGVGQGCLAENNGQIAQVPQQFNTNFRPNPQYQQQRHINNVNPQPQQQNTPSCYQQQGPNPTLNQYQSNSFNRLPTQNYNSRPAPSQLESNISQVLQREQHFRDQLFNETREVNRSMIYSMQENNRSTLQCIQTITSMMAPLLESKERENRKLKRLLSERYGISTEEDIIQAEIDDQKTDQKQIRTFNRKKVCIQQFQNSQEQINGNGQRNQQVDNSYSSQKSENKSTFKPKQSGKFSPKDKKPAFKVMDEKAVEKINLNFKKKKKVEIEAAAYCLLPNQRAFKCPEVKKPSEDLQEKVQEPVVVNQQEIKPPVQQFDQEKYDEENKSLAVQQDTGFNGFKIGGGKKFEIKMDSSKAQSILNKFQDENEDSEDILQNLKANKNKEDIKSFDEVAQQEIQMVSKRMEGKESPIPLAPKINSQENHDQNHDHHDPKFGQSQIHQSQIPILQSSESLKEQTGTQYKGTQSQVPKPVSKQKNDIQVLHFQQFEDSELSVEIGEMQQKQHMDKELFNALTGISTQDSSNFFNSQESIHLTKEKIEQSNESMEKMLECFQILQTNIENLQIKENQLINLKPLCEVENEKRKQYFSKFEKVITIETTDPLLYNICNIDRFGAQDENKISIKSLDFQQEIIKSKLKAQYPDPTEGGGKIKNKYNIVSVEKAQFWKSRCLCDTSRKKLILENRQVENIIFECKICDNKMNVGPEQIHKILKDNLGSRVTSLEWDKNWTINMYGQIVWKLACYNQFFKIQSLTIFNILHNLAQKLMKEFLEIKKSFFQKAVVKEIPSGAHCVLLITNIRKSQNKNNPNSYLIDLSDGSYMLTAFVNENEKRFNCDQEIINRIHNNQINVGEKYHFFGLYKNDNELFGKDKCHRVNTEHYFLQNKHSMYLKLNLNGMQRAHNNERLGEQAYPFFRVPLNSINQYSKQICCMDVIVIKKTAQYYLEEFTAFDTHENTNRRKRILRSKKAMERIRFLRQEAIEGNLQKDYENMFYKFQRAKDQTAAEQNMIQETEAMKEKMDDMKRDKLDCFKLCFRIKVTDAIYFEKIKQKEQDYMQSSRYDRENPVEFNQTQEYRDEIKLMKNEIQNNRTYIISFIKSSPDIYDSIQDGSRIRLYNMKPDGTISMQGNQFTNEQCVFLQFQNGRSKFENIADKLREKAGSFVTPKIKKQIQELKDFGRELVIQPIKPQNYLMNLIDITKRKDEEQIMNYKKCNEMTFIGFIVKIMYQPNPEGPNHPDSVNQVILLSAQGDIICVQVHDPHFFIKNAFPGENQRVVMDHIAFLKMSRVNIKTRDNDLIDDKKMKLIIKDYLRSVLCTDCKHSPTKSDMDPNCKSATSYDLPDNFYYLMCQTNNNTQIETESNRHMQEFKADCLEMSLLQDSVRFQLRMRQIQMIIGERQTLDKSSIQDHSSHQNTIERQEEGDGGYRTFGKENCKGQMQGYNYLNPNSLNMSTNLYNQTQMLGGKQGKDLLISSGCIENEVSPQKADHANTNQIKSTTNFNFKSKYAKNGFNDIMKIKKKSGSGLLKESISKSAQYDQIVNKALQKAQPLKVQEARVGGKDCGLT